MTKYLYKYLYHKSLKIFLFNKEILISLYSPYNKDEQKDIPIHMCHDQLEEAYQLGIDINKIEKNES
jgi:hypothetical protein